LKWTSPLWTRFWLAIALTQTEAAKSPLLVLMTVAATAVVTLLAATIYTRAAGRRTGALLLIMISVQGAGFVLRSVVGLPLTWWKLFRR